MKVLLDENLPGKLAKYLEGHECWTVAQRRWDGKKNGELLSLAAAERFDVLLTLDKSIPHQQSMTSNPIAVLIVRAKSSRLRDLLPVVPYCRAALAEIGPRQVMRIGAIGRATMSGDTQWSRTAYGAGIGIGLPWDLSIEWQGLYRCIQADCFSSSTSGASQR